MQLSPVDIEHIAALSRLTVSESETAMYAKQLSAVLTYMDMLHEVDTAHTAETCQVTGLSDVVREDAVHDCDAAVREAVRASFPQQTGGLLTVQAVFDDHI